MRASIFLVLAAFAFPLNAFAQLPDVEEAATFEARPQSWRHILVNHGSSRMVAFHEPFHCPKSGPVVTYDALLFSWNRSVGPAESVEINAGDPSTCSGSVDAAIFSDGNVEGDSRAITDIYSARQGAYKALGESTKLLNSIQAEHNSVQHVIDILTSRTQASLSERTEAGFGYRMVLQLILQALADTRGGIPALPSDSKGQKPPAVEDVMNATGLSRDEASAVVLGKRLEEWKSLLEANLQPR